jgi:alpha-D-xyloside xylohydrolase
MAGIGNAWHIPKNPQPRGQASMRFPLDAIEAGTTVTLSNGNQFQGPGITGNQTQLGSALMVRKVGDASWTPLPLHFQFASGNDKHFFATIAANTFQAGDLVQYYFKIGYTDRQTTFLHGSNGKSFATAEEAAAQADPFTFAVRFSLAAAGPFLSFDSGPHQARIFKDSGHIAIAGPDLAGTPHANVVTFAPPIIEAADRTFNIGRVLSSQPLANGLEVVQQLGAGQIRAQLTFPLEGVLRYEVVDWEGLVPDRVSIASASDGDEHFYGFGEKFNALDQAGKVVSILTFDEPGNKGDRSYKVAPWFISTRGYGFHLDSTARSRFDMRTAARGRYSVTNQASALKFNVVYGPKLTDMPMRYTGMTGRPALPPPWAFGAWIASDIWRTGGEVRYAVTKFRERGIPVSVFVFDSPWEVAYNDFAFNEAQFAIQDQFEGQTFQGFNQIADMMSFLQKNGLKVICWMTPFVNVSSIDESVPGQNMEQAKNYAEGAAGNFFVRESPNGPPLVVNWWKGRGSPVDFTNPEARDWLTRQLQALLEASEVNTNSGKEPAIGGFKTDDGEFSNGPNIYIPDTAVYANGRTGREFVNGYCLEYHRTVYNVLGTAGLIFARSGFTGTQAFPGYWAGDNEPNFGSENGLPSVIVAGLSAAMSGFSIWGHDIGGYQNANFSPISPADLFIRWTQFGCFSPIMQIHRQVNPADLRQYPWGYAQAGESTDANRALDNYRFYATLHTRLFPYLYTYAKQSEETGLPIMRPLVLMHQDDPSALGVQHTYYFGGDLIVAPVIEPNATQRRIYLPEGNWFDFWTNEQHAGRQTITWKNPAQPDEPKSKIPVFVRSGAIVPFILGDDVQTLCDANYVNNAGVMTWDGGLEVRIYPAGTSRFTVFDGTEVNSVEGAGPTSVTIASPSPRPVLLRILAPRPAAVRRDGTALPEAASSAAFEAANVAWRFDTAPGFVLVKFSHPGGTIRITL